MPLRLGNTLPAKTYDQRLSRLRGNCGWYVVHLVNEHSKRIYVARFSRSRVGQPKRLGVHQFRGTGAGQRIRDLRPSNRGKFRDSRTQTPYTRCAFRVNQHVRLEECDRRNVMGEEVRDMTTHNLKIPMDEAEVVHVTETPRGSGYLP